MTITSCVARSTAAVVIYLRRYAEIVNFCMFRAVQRRSRYISVCFERCGGGHYLFPLASVCGTGQRLHRYCVISLFIYLLLNNNIIILGKHPFCYILFSLSLSNFVKLLNPTTNLHFETTVVIVLFPHNKTKFNYLKQTFLSTNNYFKNMYDMVPNLFIGSLFLYPFKAFQSSHEEFGIGIKNRDLILQESGSDFPRRMSTTSDERPQASIP